MEGSLARAGPLPEVGAGLAHPHLPSASSQSLQAASAAWIPYIISHLTVNLADVLLLDLAMR